MNKQERVVQKIEQDKAIQKNLKKLTHFTSTDVYVHGQRYIKAIKEGRMLCVIPSVSNSGMSRQIKFLECSKGKTQYHYYNFFGLFTSLGFRKAGKYGDCVSVSGCGMDMIFATNYEIIHMLHRLGFISRVQCENLAQQTPTVI